MRPIDFTRHGRSWVAGLAALVLAGCSAESVSPNPLNPEDPDPDGGPGSDGGGSGCDAGLCAGPVGQVFTSLVDGGCALSSARPSFTWTQSLTIGSLDDQGNLISATETRALVAFDGKLFAGLGIWTDPGRSDPDQPGPMVMRLERADGRWQQDMELDFRLPKADGGSTLKYNNISEMAAVEFQHDKDGNSLSSPKKFLVVGVWGSRGTIEAFVRNVAGDWTKDTLFTAAPGGVGCRGGLHIRSITGHNTATTSEILVGTNSSGDCLPAVYRGRYDPTAPSEILWDAAPESWDPVPGADDRVTSLAEANGEVFATVCEKVYKRSDSGQTWSHVYSFPGGWCDSNPGENGYRRATPLPVQGGPDQLYLAVEGSASEVDTLDLGSYVKTKELDLKRFLARCFGTNAGYIIAGYNNILPYQLSTPSLLIGLEAKTPKVSGSWNGWHPDGWMLIRKNSKDYELQEVRLPDSQFSVKPVLVATRTIIRSPFPGEESTVIYAGGFDANHETAHDTAWLYRGVKVQ